MSGFTFPFRALLSYRRNRRDLCRQLLAQVLADEAGLASERKRVLSDRTRQLDEIRQLSRPGPVAVDRAASRRFHSLQLLAQVRGLEEKRRVIAGQLQLCRQALAKAEADVQVLERLEERQRAEFLYQAERRAQHEREEVWTACRIVEAAR